MQNLKSVSLELSLKPFKKLDPEYIESVCRKVFHQWQGLTAEAKVIKILMWTSDGSELLDYNGDLSAVFEWDRFIGGANTRQNWDKVNDPEGVGLHTRHYDYMTNPPVMHYTDLKNIIATLKRVGKEITGRNILVGETFDPGPEFALSDFKYNRHNEICEGGSMGKKSMVCCYNTLHADDRAYAAYPSGIPEGTLFGEFFSKQAQCFLADIGFDYLWLSNGFGFGTETWKVTGALYDGERFYPEKLKDCEHKIIEFWQVFRKYCSFPLETRGTNLTVGIDFSTDAVNHKMIYEGNFNLLPPPNSPWAALDGNFGLELAGYLSRAAELPGEDYLFRFYIHDPWWLNSPWIDRYEGQPHDIYLPMSCARINQNGKTVVANHLNLLSIDNSYGDMPDRVPREVTPYLVSAYENAPDAPSPFVWVYPFDEYSTMAGGRLEKSFFEDWFFVAAINRGLPVSTVISTGNFAKLRQANAGFLQNSVLVTPVPERGSKVAAALCGFVQNGGKVLFYGSTQNADPAILNLLQLKQEQPLTGSFALKLLPQVCTGLKNGAYSENLKYGGPLTDGGLLEVPAQNATGLTVVAKAEQSGADRAIAVTVALPNWQGGSAAWCRGADCSRAGANNDDSVMADSTVKTGRFPVEILPRELCKTFGYGVGVLKRSAACKEPVVLMHRHQNSLWFSGYCPDTTIELTLKTPLGAPLLLANETYLDANGAAHYHLPRAWRHECRVFVEKQAEGFGSLHCIEAISTKIDVRRRLQVNGLKNATLYFLPENGCPENSSFLLNSYYPHCVGQECRHSVVDTCYGKALKLEDVTGTVLFMDMIHN